MNTKENREARLSYEVGIVLCGAVRNFIKESIFRGAEIEFFESSGWLMRTFVIKGKVDDVLFIKRNLDRIGR